MDTKEKVTNSNFYVFYKQIKKRGFMMKNLVLLILAAILCFTFTSCGKSEAALACEKAIWKIGEVTFESEEAIVAAEEAYNALTEKEQKQIEESATILVESRTAYETAVKLNDVVVLIDKIGDEIKISSESKIIAAEKAYDSLSDEEKEQIKESGEKLALLREEYEKVVSSTVQEVIDSIDSIGEVTLESENLIENAKNKYDILDYKLRSLVTNHDVLEEAEKEYGELLEAKKKEEEAKKKAENEQIIKEYMPKFDVSYDEVTGATFYVHKNDPRYLNSRTFVLPRILELDGNYYMAIYYTYTGKNMIFWEELTIVTDNEKYYKSFSYFDVEHDIVHDCEYTHETAYPSDLIMLKDMSESEKTIVRFRGDSKQYDLILSNTDKNIIKDVLTLYSALIA